MTIIDAFVVKLGLDSSDLDKKAPAAGKKIKDLEDATTKQGKSLKNMSKAAKEGSTSLGELAATLGGLIAVIGGSEAIKSFTMSMIEGTAAVGRFAANLGLSTSTVSAWGNMAQEIGGSAKDVQTSFELITKAQTDLAMTGESSMIPFLNTLGVRLTDASGKARASNDVFMDMADGLKKYEARTSRPMAVEFAKQFGFSETSINLMLESRQELEKNLAAQKAYGDQVAKFQPTAIAMQKAIADLKQQWTLLGLKMLQTVAPAMQKVLGWIKSLTDWLQNHKDVTLAFGAAIGVITVAVGGLTAAVAVLTLATAALDLAASPLLATLAAIAAPVLAAVAAVVALGAAFLALKSDYDVWKGGGKSFFDWSTVAPGIATFKAAMKDVGGIAKNTLMGIYWDATAAWRAVHGDFKGAEQAESRSAAFDKGTLSHIEHDPGKLIKTYQAAKAKAKPAPAAVAGGSISDQAKAQAQRVSKMTGIPADILWAQWAHETGNFTNRGARDLNNLAGVNVVGGKGQDYRKFKSLDEFGNYYAHLMRANGRYAGASKARTPDEFAAVLKAGGYYSDNQANYAKGIRQFDLQYLRGIQGATRSMTV